MKAIFPVVLLSVLFLMSCNRNQRQVKRIDGKWNVVEATIEGYGESDPDVIYEFEFGKLKHDEFLDFSVHNFETNSVETGVYTIDDSGQTLSLTVSDGFGFSYREYRITRLSFRKMILESDDVATGEFSRIVLKKVN